MLNWLFGGSVNKLVAKKEKNLDKAMNYSKNHKK